MRELVGKLLISHPGFKQGTFFSKCVIYMYQHDVNGSIGLVLNKPSTYTVAQIMQHKDYLYEGTELVWKGGPVNESAMIMLHTDDWYSSNTMSVGPGTAISSDEFMISKIAMNNTPTLWRMYQGMCGWSPGQLETEIKRDKGWLIADVPNPDFLFSATGNNQWLQAIDLCSQQTMQQYF